MGTAGQGRRRGDAAIDYMHFRHRAARWRRRVQRVVVRRYLRALWRAVIPCGALPRGAGPRPDA